MRLLVRFADGVVVAVVVAQRTEWTWGLHRVHGEAMVLSIVGVKEFLLHHVDAVDLSSCSFPANSDQRSAYSCSLGVVAVRRPSHALGGLGVGRILLKHLGGGGDLEASLRHARPQTPKTHEIQVFHSNSRLSKVFWNPCLGHDTIWRPGQGDEGICRQRKHVDK